MTHISWSSDFASWDSDFALYYGLNTILFGKRNHKYGKIFEPPSQENLSSRIPTRVDSNQPAQLQRLASLDILDLASIGIILSRQRTIKAVIRLRGCAG